MKCWIVFLGFIFSFISFAEYCDFGGRTWTRANPTNDSKPPNRIPGIFSISGSAGGEKVVFNSSSRNHLPTSHGRAYGYDRPASEDLFLFDRATGTLRSLPEAFWRLEEESIHIRGGGLRGNGPFVVISYTPDMDSYHVALWNIETDEVSVVARDPYGLSMSQDMKWMVTNKGPRDREVWLKNLNTNEEKQIDIGLDGRSMGATGKISEDGSRVYLVTTKRGSRKTFYVYEVESGDLYPMSQIVTGFPEEVHGNAGIWGRNFRGDRFFFGRDDWYFVDLRTGTFSYLPMQALWGASLDREGRRFLHSDRESFFIHDLSTGEREHLFFHQTEIGYNGNPVSKWAGESSMIMTTNVDCETGHRSERHRNYLYIVDL